MVPIEDNYTGRETYKGGVVLLKIKEMFEKHNLMEMAKECPFKHFFTAPPLQFSKALIHQLLLRKIKSKNNDKIQFLIGGNQLRFEIGKFAGLDCSALPSEAELKENSASQRLRVEYFNTTGVVKSQH